MSQTGDLSNVVDPVAWLRATPPFHALPPPLFDEAARALEVTFQPAGVWLATTGGTPLEHLYVIRKGAVRLHRAGGATDLLEEGEMFGYTSLLSGAATTDAVVEEDLLAYRLPAAQFRRLLSHAGFAAHFATGLAERLRTTVERRRTPSFQADLGLQVDQLVTRPPEWIDGNATVGAAAQRMRQEHISSLLVRTDPPAIVTDRDFRNRVLASGRGPEQPVAEIASRPLRTLTSSAPLYEAWNMLLDAGVHHLPITRDGEILGVITDTDLLRHVARGPLAMLWQVERLSSRLALGGYAQQVTDMVTSLLAGRLDPGIIAGFVARLNDILVGRLLKWAEAELGPAPAPYAWVVFGSEGRMEQTLLTDQDNALVYADEGEPQRGWFKALAERVGADLQTAGFPSCPGGYMASRWHGPLSEWVGRFRGWMDVPQPDALLASSIFFDYRKVNGSLDLSPLDAVVSGAADKPLFLRWMARTAVMDRPPSIWLRFGGSSRAVDLKRHGSAPIVALARVYALELRATARNTIDRLGAAARAEPSDDWEALIESYRFILGLRLRLQLRAIAEGAPPVHEVRLSTLTALERSRLKDAFAAVRDWQAGAAHRFQADF